jgi:hypothetical protein
MTLGFAPDTVVPSDPYASNLRAFVLGLLPLTCRLRRTPARTRIASISQAANVAGIGSANPGGLTDLRGSAARSTPRSSDLYSSSAKAR